MANTGYKQATIAYRVDAKTGEPLDRTGRPTRLSGLRQAVMLLTGTANPDPLKYEVVGFFNVKSTVDGQPTYIIDGNDCPAGSISVTPTRILLTPNGPAVAVTLTSSEAWQASTVPFATVSPALGQGGEYTVQITPNAINGQGYVVFTQPRTGETARVYVISTDAPDAWILDTGFWDDLGFWKSNGIWNY